MSTDDKLHAAYAALKSENERLKKYIGDCEYDMPSLRADIAKEREVVRVLREALNKIGTALPPNALSMEARKALAKADEIRGKE